jgi:plastocyanin
MKTFFLSLILAAILVTAARADDAQVAIKDHIFTPDTLTVKAGTKVTWVNRDDDPHTVADAGNKKIFRSGALDTGESFSYTFNTPGAYAYFCTMHPNMAGKIVVTQP